MKKNITSGPCLIKWHNDDRPKKRIVKTTCKLTLKEVAAQWLHVPLSVSALH